MFNLLGKWLIAAETALERRLDKNAIDYDRIDDLIVDVEGDPAKWQDHNAFMRTLLN